jgi:recombination protein RecR
MIPEEIRAFVAQVSKLPSIGPRQATRLAFYIAQQGKAAITDLRDAIDRLLELKNCEQCFRISKTINGLCDICANPSRNQGIIAVVEKETDILSLENTRKFTGRYLVLGELSKDAVLTGLQKLRLNHLKSFIQQRLAGMATEIIIALNPTTYGDLDASLVAEELKPLTKKISRLGRGLPTGGEIEFADDETLGSALDQRK